MDLERTYSRDRFRIDPSNEVITTPVALVRSITSRSQKSLRSQQSSRSRVGEQSSRAEQLKKIETDFGSQPDFEKGDRIERIASRSPSILDSPSRSSTSSDTSTEHDEDAPVQRILRFEDGDPENPVNWRRPKKVYAVIVAIISVLNSTMNSSLAAGAQGPISRHFNEHNQARLILPTSMYLVGYVCGPMAWGPLSESYGRKGVMMYAFSILTIFSVASALAPNFAALVIFRLFVGIGGSAAISVVGGICADIYNNPISRGRSMALFMAATTFGPVLGPLVAGFISVLSWSWAFWIGAIFAGASWPFFFFFPETYGPTILKRRALRMRKETGDETIVAALELEKTDLTHIVTVILTRPLRMICFEPLVFFTCLYLSYAYAIFYIYLQSYPIVFGGIYHFTAGEVGLTFLPIAVGAACSAVIYLTWDSILQKAHRQNKVWVQNEEMQRLPLACIAGPFFVISSFWLAWTAKESIHWIVPTLAGILFGIGYLLLFMALLNYLVDAYEVFAASAMAAASLTRSSFGAVLPFAAKPMYSALGVACKGYESPGFFSLVLCIVPFAFLRWGTRLKEKSKFCQYLRAKKQEEEEERERERRGGVDAQPGVASNEGKEREEV